VLQKEISRMHFDFIHWWIDNRQAPNGEFGNTTGDDTDLTGDWVSMALLSDRDGKIRRSQRLLTDFVWNHRMSNGLNKGMSDALHAYEAGNNMQPFAALLDYGNPVLMERQFMTSRRYDGFLMTDPVDGKRRLVGGFFNSEEVRPGSRYKKQNHNRLILHAGLYTMFYNGHPGLLKLMTEYYDGSPPMRRGRTGDLEYALYAHTGDKRFVERCKYPARYHNWPRLLGITKASPGDLKHLTGPPNNRKLMRRYNAWRFTGDKKYLVEALRYLWRELYYKYDMVTRTEQSGDRVHLTWLGSKTLTDHMYFGGMPGARNELLPLHTVSYESFSSNFAGLVINDTTEALRWIGYNFEPTEQEGKLRVWRLVPGAYEIRMGEDRDGDDRVDADAKKVTLGLKRYEPIPVTLPSRKLYVVEAKLLRKDPVPLYDRCDLAVTHEDAVREGASLRVIVHNIGCKPSGPFTVEVKEGADRVLATKRHGGLDGVADLNDKKIVLTFAGLPAHGDLQVHVVGPAKEITETNNTAWIRRQL